MCAEDLPSTGNHSAILVRVRVPEHHFLVVVPCFKKAAILQRTPQGAANFRCVAQVFDGLEQGHGHQAGILTLCLDRYSSQPRKPHDCENVFDTGCATDDVLSYCFRRATTLDLRYRTKSFEYICRLRR